MTAYLLDTTALSETTKPRPNVGFRSWLNRADVADTFIGAPSLAEIEVGVACLPRSAKRDRMERWLGELTASFASRILPFDLAAARVWGRALAQARRDGRSLAVVDSQLAAIAVVHRLTVVTHNARYFDRDAFAGLDVIDPWSS